MRGPVALLYLIGCDKGALVGSLASRTVEPPAERLGPPLRRRS